MNYKLEYLSYNMNASPIVVVCGYSLIERMNNTYLTLGYNQH